MSGSSSPLSSSGSVSSLGSTSSISPSSLLNFESRAGNSSINEQDLRELAREDTTGTLFKSTQLLLGDRLSLCSLDQAQKIMNSLSEIAPDQRNQVAQETVDLSKKFFSRMTPNKAKVLLMENSHPQLGSHMNAFIQHIGDSKKGLELMQTILERYAPDGAKVLQRLNELFVGLNKSTHHALLKVVLNTITSSSEVVELLDTINTLKNLLGREKSSIITSLLENFSQDPVSGCKELNTLLEKLETAFERDKFCEPLMGLLEEKSASFAEKSCLLQVAQDLLSSNGTSARSKEGNLVVLHTLKRLLGTFREENRSVSEEEKMDFYGQIRDLIARHSFDEARLLLESMHPFSPVATEGMAVATSLKKWIDARKERDLPVGLQELNAIGHAVSLQKKASEAIAKIEQPNSRTKKQMQADAQKGSASAAQGLFPE